MEAEACELDDREIIVVDLPESGKSKIGELPLTDLQQSLLREKFAVPVAYFVFVLIGKDGNVKLRSRRLVLPDELFALIDRMPMRKEEVRRKTNKPLI